MFLTEYPTRKPTALLINCGKGRPPSYKYLKVWGCLANVEVLVPKKTKIGPKIVDCVFIGYTHNSSAYRFLTYKSKIPNINVNTIIDSRNVVFFKHVFPYKKGQELSSQKRTYDCTQSQETNDNQTQEASNGLDQHDLTDDKPR